MRGAGKVSWEKPGKALLSARVKRLARYLKLTPAQVQKIRDIRQAHREAMTQLKLDKKRSGALVFASVLQARPDAAGADKLFAPLLALKAKKMRQGFQTKQRLSKQLTPVQWKKLLLLSVTRGRDGKAYGKRGRGKGFDRGRRGGGKGWRKGSGRRGHAGKGMRRGGKGRHFGKGRRLGEGKGRRFGKGMGFDFHAWQRSDVDRGGL